MAKLKNIRYLLKVELNKMQAYGCKKHEDKKKTKKERSIAKSEGKTLRERDEINHSRDKIYSYTTMKTYQQQIGYFATFLNDRGLGKITIDQAREHIQEYMVFLAKKEKSASTIHTALAACTKACHAVMRDYHIPERRLADMTRGRKEVQHDEKNQRLYGDLLEANRLIGVRRRELASIRVRDIEEQPDMTIIHTIGKGGKKNVQIITDEAEREQIRQYCAGKGPDEFLFERKRIQQCDGDFHAMRAERAKTIYNRVVSDMERNPERREHYRDFVIRTCIESGKNIPKNLEKPYICRETFRQYLLENGKAVEYDRLAAMYVSLTVLNHWRVDTTVQHYLTK